MNKLVFAEMDIGASTFTVIEESREAAEKLLREAFDKYRETKPAYPWDDYSVIFRDMTVGEVMLDGAGFHMDPFNQKRWPCGYVQCAMTGTWFATEDYPMAEQVAGSWIMSPGDHTPEEVAAVLDLPEQRVYDEMGLEYPL